jgi:hypothetical protein
MKKYILLVLAMVGVTSAHADIYCRWDPTASPSSFIRVHPRTKTAYSITGWPQKKTSYREVVVQRTKTGFNILVFGDVPLIQANYTGAGTTWYDQNEVTYPFEAYWNPKVQGGPTRQAIRGVCWTDKLQKTGRNF